MFPVSPDLTDKTGTIIDASDDHDAVRNTVRAEMAAAEAAWELRVQLWRDADAQPIEDASSEWKEEDSPFLTVATVHAGPQDSWSAALIDSV